MPTGPAAGMLKLLTRSKSTRRSDNHLPVVITNKRYSAVEPAASAGAGKTIINSSGIDSVVHTVPQHSATAALRRPSAKLREGVRHRTHASKRNHQVNQLKLLKS
ncbi:hypothetical protein O3M35_013191 [Rhynocoris fuscipes]|uniref:Uncharacterized protein n=1 Tax=Rhynocoris fuscipes TaxID=488301 RepID=A0AAW1CJV9_9HEMI